MQHRRPAWWPVEFTPEQLGAHVIGMDMDTAMYKIMAADCDCLVRQQDRNEWPAPDDFHPYRIQLYVTKDRVTSFEVG